MNASLRYLSTVAVALLVLNAFAEDPGQAAGAGQASPDLTITVHKNPGCGCCDLWAEHLEEHGFSVEVTEDAGILDLKEAAGIPGPLYSCHTAFIAGYFVEGHVPARDILSLLKLKPERVTGLAVPGMPLGSPGMEHPRPQTFNTIAVLESGDAYIFARHEPGEDFSQKAD